MTFKYESTGDNEKLEVNGVRLFERVGCSMEITCNIDDLDELLKLIDKCRSKQPEHLWVDPSVLD